MLGVDERRDPDETTAALAAALSRSPDEISGALRDAPQAVLSTTDADEGAQVVLRVRRAGGYARLVETRTPAHRHRSGAHPRGGAGLSSEAAPADMELGSLNKPTDSLLELAGALESIALTTPVQTPPSLRPPSSDAHALSVERGGEPPETFLPVPSGPISAPPTAPSAPPHHRGGHQRDLTTRGARAVGGSTDARGTDAGSSITRGTTTPGAESLPSFFAELPGTLMIPLRGQSPIALFLLTLASWGTGLLALTLLQIQLVLAFNYVLRGVATLFALSLVLGVLFQYARRCFFAGYAGDTKPQPYSILDSFFEFYLVPGVQLLLAQALLVVPALALAFGLGFWGVQAPGWLVGLTVAFYVLYPPLGIALAASRSHPFGFWYLPLVWQFVRRAPFSFAVVVLLGLLSYLAPMAVMRLTVVTEYAPLLALASAAWAYGHAAQAAALGALARHLES